MNNSPYDKYNITLGRITPSSIFLAKTRMIITVRKNVRLAVIIFRNPHISEEFIIYWLPKLEYNKYNYIRFATKEEINTDMPLNITPSPDTTIRVLMTYKKLNKLINVEEQIITTPERKGFVAVEWGGTEIK